MPVPSLFCPTAWEVVQLAVHQILDLIILVRVQASQPNLTNRGQATDFDL